MPVTKRAVTPVNASINRLPQNIKQDELACIANGTLANLVRQLSSLSKHAENIFGEIFNEALKIDYKATTLGERIEKLTVKVSKLESSTEEVNIAEISLRKQFKSGFTIDQQSLSRSTMPDAMGEQYTICEAPPRLNRLNKFRTDNTEGLKFYTDPDFFFNLWKEEMLKDTGNHKKAHKPRVPGQQKQRKKPRKAENMNERYVQDALRRGEVLMNTDMRPTFAQQQQHATQRQLSISGATGNGNLPHMMNGQIKADGSRPGTLNLAQQYETDYGYGTGESRSTTGSHPQGAHGGAAGIVPTAGHPRYGNIHQPPPPQQLPYSVYSEQQAQYGEAESHYASSSAAATSAHVARVSLQNQPGGSSSGNGGRGNLQQQYVPSPDAVHTPHHRNVPQQHRRRSSPEPVNLPVFVDQRLPYIQSGSSNNQQHRQQSFEDTYGTHAGTPDSSADGSPSRRPTSRPPPPPSMSNYVNGDVSQQMTRMTMHQHSGSPESFPPPPPDFLDATDSFHQQSPSPPPPPPVVATLGGQAGSRPPPVSGAAPPPPPPPPPPMGASGGLILPLARPAAGSSAAPPPKAKSPVYDPRSDLLAQIRSGISLRKSQSKKANEEAAKTAAAGHDVAAILRRRMQIGMSDDESSDNSDNDSDWDD